MAESTKAVQSLKHAANYTKLAFREFGPKSYKKGQGALLKVIHKFGEDGSIEKKKAEKTLNWRGKDLRHVAKKAEKNGYITIEDPEFAFRMMLTDKGQEIVEKRLAAEDRTADTIMGALTDEEVETLIALTDKISKTCEDLGIDYSVIEKKEGEKHHHRGHHHDGEDCEKHGCGHHHGHGAGMGHCHKHTHGCGHHHGRGHRHEGPQYVFVFEGGGHGCCHGDR